MQLAYAQDFASFRSRARALLTADVRPEHVHIRDRAAQQSSLFALNTEPVAEPAAEPEVNGTAEPRFKVPRRFVELAELAVLARRDDRFDLPYRILYRLAHGEPQLLRDLLDEDVRELQKRSQTVRRDEHHMHAFVRFRRSQVDGHEVFVAYYEPEHLILRLAAPFFERRFAAQRWAILTPDESAYWDGQTLRYGPAAPRSEAPREDELEELFRVYYEATFNPARANLKLFQQHVPRAFRRGMPELSNTSTLLSPSPTRAAPDKSVAQVPHVESLVELTHCAASCRACSLGERATQTVFGEGPSDAELCLVGEQPGDEEDRRGSPFVGPAGQVLDRALAEAGLVRDKIYVTNAVKHFSFRPEGKKRLHVRPTWNEVEACRPWLRAELALIKPRLIVCLGATAAQSFLGRRFSITQNRGRTFETPWASAFLVSYHPSAVLRASSENERQTLYAALVEDLTRAVALLAG